MTATSTDLVFVDSLQLHVSIGQDCWGRNRPQLVEVSVYLHLNTDFLNRCGTTDDVHDSVNYGTLAKSISQLAQDQSVSFGSVGGLIDVIGKTALALAGEAAEKVRVVVNLPKLILLANGLSVDVMIPAGHSVAGVSRVVHVKDLVLPVIIGVNPPEREAKQRVSMNITIHENGEPLSSPSVDYPGIVSAIQSQLESSAYLTLEKFTLEAVRMVCLTSDRFTMVTIRVQKPSAISFAHSSGVEMTRSRLSFISPQAT